MRPKVDQQIRWGIGAAVVAVALVAVLALVPDPLFRQKVWRTTFDNVDGLSPGAPVYFRGKAVGSIRSVDLAPDSRTFAIRMGVRRDWRPSACAYAKIAESNPFTTPRVELVALETTAQACPAALAVAACSALPAPAGQRGVPGCVRGPGLFETAAVAIAQAAEVAKTASAMAQKVQAMMNAGGPKGPGAVDVNKLVADVTTTLASVNEMSTRLNASLAPGHGDIALTLSNVRQASDQAKTIDVKSINATLRQTQALMEANQAKINTLIDESTAISTDTRVLLENLSASLTTTTANLQRTTDNLDALTERLSGDPTYVLRGQAYKDPPSSGGRK